MSMTRSIPPAAPRSTLVPRLRGSAVLLLALVACAPDAQPDTGLASAQVAPPPTLAVSELVDGARATASLLDVRDAESVAFFVSTDGLGDGPCIPDGDCLGIVAPTLLGLTPPNDAGRAAVDFDVPGTAGDTLALQAALRIDGTWQTEPVVERVVGDGQQAPCPLDAVDGTSPETTRQLPLLEDQSLAGFGLTLGGTAGDTADAGDRFAMDVAPGCRLDLFPVCKSDLSRVTASVELDGLTMLPFGELTTVRNDTADDVEAIVELYLADTEQCVLYDLAVAYTCNVPPVVDTVTLDVEGGDTCGVWTCTGTATDADGDDLTLSYAWDVDGTVVADQPTYRADLDDGQVLTCTVTATDPWGDSTSTRTSATATAGLDGVTAKIGGATRVGSTLVCDAAAELACGDIAWSYRWFLDGIDLGVDLAALATDELPVGGALTCEATATSGSEAVSATSAPITLAPAEVVLTGDGGQTGFSVGILGDLDGDGFGSVTLGAPTYSEVASYAGRIYVLDADLTTATVALADLEGGTGGFLIDGISGDYDLETMACGEFVYPSGCPTEVSLYDLEAFAGGAPGAALGYALSHGDFDGDAISDLLTSAPFEQLTSIWTGRTYMASGATLESAPLWDIVDDDSLSGFVVDGECGRRRNVGIPALEQFDVSNGDLSGTAIAGIGDYNGDGLDDFAIQSLNAGDAETGMVYVVFGRDDGQRLGLERFYEMGCDNSGGTGAGTELAALGMAHRGRDDGGFGTGSAWGHKLAPVGDFDGDGYDEVVFTGLNDTFVQVIAGRPDGGLVTAEDTLDPADGWSFRTPGFAFGSEGNSGVLMLGFPNAGGGDMNGDGLDDVVVVHTDVEEDSPFTVAFGRTTRGASTITSNRTGALGFAVTGGLPAMRTGTGSAAIVGDLNGDGLDDAAVGFPEGSGEVWVLYGRADGRPTVDKSELDAGTAGFILRPNLSTDAFGSSLAGGDVDGDGLADLIAGAPGRDDTDAGAALLVFGSDRTNALTDVGSAGDDTLVGTGDIDRMVGGRGHDTLIGGGGLDVLYGGAGNDRLEVADALFRRVHGGPGHDTLTLGATAGDLDVSTMGRRLDSLETLALSGQSLTVRAVDVVGLSGDNTVRVRGTGTVVVRPGDDWADGGVLEEDDTTWRMFVDGRARLQVADSMDVDIPPTVQPAAFTVPENTLGVAGAVTAVDPDGGSVQFAITGGAGAGEMAIDPDTGIVTVVDNSAFDFEGDAEHDLEVTVTDDEGLSTVIDVSVALTDVNEAPRFTESGPILLGTEETLGLDATVLGAVLASDVDAGDALTYSLTGADAGRFAIDERGEIRVADSQVLDFETSPLLQFQAVVTDAGGLTDTLAIDVEVYDADVIESTVSFTFVTTDEVVADTEDAEKAFEECFDFGAGDYAYSETVAPPSIFPFIDIPVSADMDISGELCVQFGIDKTNGTIDASVPLDFTFTVPDEVPLGGTFTLGSAFAPSRDITYQLQFPATEIYAGYTTNEFDAYIDMTYCLSPLI
jgi:hypothetical protein